MDSHILVERPARFAGAVQVVRFNRPRKKNALTREMYAMLVEALRAGDGDDRVRVHVVLGSQDCFTAGNDMHDFAGHANGASLSGSHVVAFLKTLVQTAKPIVSGVDGLAIGIGATIHFHCDLTLATPRALFRTPFVDLALVPEAGSSLLGPATMGHQRAFAMLAAGIGLSAEEARDAGLIWKVVDEDALEAETLAAADMLAAKPPRALQLSRDLLRRGMREALMRRIDEEMRLFSERLVSPEARAALEAFTSRRKTG